MFGFANYLFSVDHGYFFRHIRTDKADIWKVIYNALRTFDL